VQIQALIIEGVVAETRDAMEGSNIGFNIKVTKPPIFNEEVGKVEGFIMAYRLYLRIRMML